MGTFTSQLVNYAALSSLCLQAILNLDYNWGQHVQVSLVHVP